MNYAEMSFRLTKENQFNRVKAYNLPDLLDIILDDSVDFINRCIDVGNNRTSQFQYQKSRYVAKHFNIDAEKIIVLDPDQNTYLVPSESINGKFYEVNMDLGLCECPQGMLKGPCKHKHVLAEKCQVISADVIPNHNPHVRAFYRSLATGESRDANWYRSLNEQDEVENSIQSMGVFDFMKPNAEEDIEDVSLDDNVEDDDQEENEGDDMADENEREKESEKGDDLENHDLVKNTFLTTIQRFFWGCD